MSDETPAGPTPTPAAGPPPPAAPTPAPPRAAVPDTGTVRLRFLAGALGHAAGEVADVPREMVDDLDGLVRRDIVEVVPADA